MRWLSLVSFFLVFFVLFAFGEPENPEEIDYLLFLPDESRWFVNETQAMIQLDNLAKYLLGRDLTPGQVYVYGYAAFAENDIDPVGLSRERALFVIGELQRRGVSRNLFSAPVAHGSVNLWSANTNEEDRSPNRRIRVVLDGNVVTPEVIKEPETIKEQETIKENEPEIIISGADDKDPVSQKAAAEKTGAEFPWRLLFLLLLLALIAALIYLLSKRKKDQPAKPAESVKAEPAKVEPAKAEPVKTEPARVEPVKTEPVKDEPVKTEPAKAEPVKAEPVTVEPVKAEPVKTEPAKTAPVKTEQVVPVVIIRKNAVDLDEEIRRRAYELYVERGFQNGDDAGDWYRALNDVCAKYEAAGCRIYYDGEYWRASL